MKTQLKRTIAVAIAIALLGAAAGCSKNSSFHSEVARIAASSEPEGFASSDPSGDFLDDAKLHRDILVNFGADINTGRDGKPLEAHNGASLFQREDWSSNKPMQGFDYFAWNFGQLWNEGITPEERAAKYAHPSGQDNMGWFFPQKLYEDRAQQYFDVTTDYLRSIPEYDAKNEGYNMQAGFGMGGAPQIELRSVKQQDDVLKLHITLVYDAADPTLHKDKILSVRMSGDGSYKFTGYEAENSSGDAEVSDETAVFALEAHGEDQKTMGVGDIIGDWTLSDLQIQYDDAHKIRMLNATFAGEVTLKGTLTRNNLVEVGYDFCVDEEDEGKMPHYISPDMGEKDVVMFMLDLPGDIAKTLSLPHGKAKECKITISAYRFIFAYRTAPSGATVVDLELL